MRIGLEITKGKYPNEKMKEKMATLGALSMMLGIAVELAEDGEKQEAWRIMSSVSMMGNQLECDEFNSLYSGVALYISYLNKRNELYYQELLKENISKIIPGCKVVTKKTNGKDIPDAWVEMDGEVLPVEVKLRDFNDKALAQLNRYIQAYKTNGGIAVGRRLSTKQQENILFICIDEFEKVEK